MPGVRLSRLSSRLLSKKPWQAKSRIGPASPPAGAKGRAGAPTAVVVDSQSVKTTEAGDAPVSGGDRRRGFGQGKLGLVRGASDFDVPGNPGGQLNLETVLAAAQTRLPKIGAIAVGERAHHAFAIDQDVEADRPLGVEFVLRPA